MPKTLKPEIVTYPKSLLKPDSGQLVERVVRDAEDETAARAQGFKTGEELWP